MSQVNFNTRSVEQSGQTQSVDGSPRMGAGRTGGVTLPPPSTESGSQSKSVNGLSQPQLPLPTRGTGTGLSLEQIFEALGMNERQTAVNKGVANIKAKGEEIKELHDKKMKEIQKNLDAIKSKGILSQFTRAFKWIGMVVGAIGSIAAIAAGAMTGNPLLVAGGLIGLTMSIDAMVSEGTGGKHSIGGAIAKGLVKCGCSEETAQKWALGITIAITIAGAACSIMGGFSSAASAATGIAKAITTLSTATNIIGACTSVAGGITSAVAAKYDHDIAKAKAELKELEAVLETLRQLMDSEEKLVESMMERNQELFGKVKDIVDGNIATQTAVAGGSPAMA